MEDQNKIDDISYIDNAETNGFFYTMDKFVNHIDDDDIYKKIESKYSEIGKANISNIVKNKVFLKFFEDEDFIIEILSYYNIDIYELFRLLLLKYDFVFKGKFLLNLKRIVKEKQYGQYTDLSK